MAIESSANQPSSELADMIASDDYWDEPIDPAEWLIGDDKLTYIRERRQARRNTDMIQKIGNVAFSLQGGGSVEPLEAGDGYPEIPDDSRKVIRIVIDSRTVLYKGSAEARSLKQYEKLLDEEVEGFDKLAEEMLDPDILWAPTAWSVKSAGMVKAFAIERNMLYMRPNSEVNFGVCVESTDIADHAYLEANSADAVIPMLPVGATYKFVTLLGDRMSKVVKADVMEADGVVWKDRPKKPPKDKSRERERSLLPKPAWGLGFQLGHAS